MTTAAAIVLVAFVVVASANWWSRWRDDARLEQWTKPLATILVIALAIALDAPAAATAWCVVALVLCLAGDVLLLPAVDRFVFGLVAFLLGHLTFIGMFVTLGLDATWLAAPAVLAMLVLGTTIGARIVHAAGERDRGLGTPVAAYLGVIALMAVFAWATGRPWALVGATAFVASDSILGWRQFVAARGWMPVAIMSTYHLALVALTLSLIG